ncbi:MFS transporter, partial [Streptomyces sp. NRRL S-481]
MPSATKTTARPAGTTPGRRSRTPAPGLFLTLIAVCSAVTAANIYLAAPLLSLMARDFGSTPSAVAWIASVAQLGYAVGLLFFAPLGDSANRRRLVAGLTMVTAVALAASATAPGVTALAVAMFVASAATVIPQLLVPLVAERAPADRR